MLRAEDMVYPCIERTGDVCAEPRDAFCQVFIERFGPNGNRRRGTEQYPEKFKDYSSVVIEQVSNEVNNLLTGCTGNNDPYLSVRDYITDNEDEVGLFRVISNIAAHTVCQEAIARTNNYKHYLIGFAQEDSAKWQELDTETRELFQLESHDTQQVADLFYKLFESRYLIRRGELLELLQIQSQRVLSAQDFNEAKWMTEASGSEWIHTSLRWRKHPRIARFIAAILPTL